MEIKTITERLKAIERFNLDSNIENKGSYISTKRNYSIDGDYIDSCDIIYYLYKVNKNKHYDTFNCRWQISN